MPLEKCFENTYVELLYCYEVLPEENILSEREAMYRQKLISLCKEINDKYVKNIEEVSY